ncbi:hypothetical protein EU534_02365 [Candidatus Heimdallarchaeota archaeon]|nr:MAG: hypothetical protein EU534_02365 [Candidatus Heimdallarchaeota archaeon]
MKRIITIDVLRGVSIFLMTIFHTWTNVVDLSPFFNTPIEVFLKEQPFMLVLGALFYILGHSRTFFLFISAIIHTYNFMKKLERGVNPEKLLGTNIIKGFVVYILGIIREGIFSPWGTIDEFILTGRINVNDLKLGYLFETLQIIGLSIIALSITCYIFFKLNLHNRSWIFFIYSSIMAVVFLFPAPYLHEAINNFVGQDISSGTHGGEFHNVSDYFTRFFWMSMAGRESPIFPNFFVAFIGGIFGYFLAKPKPSRKILNYGAIAATILLSGGILMFIFVYNANFDINMRIHETWYMLANMGLQIYYVVALLAMFEFRQKADLNKYAKWTRIIRRWSLVALTVYMIQYVDLFMRIHCTRTVGFDFTLRYFINKGWFLAGQPIQPPLVGYHILNFTTRHQVGMGWSIFMLIVAAVYFDIIIRLWEKIRFIGTWEWILIKLLRLFAGKKHYNSARIKVQESLYDVEPISFASKRIKKRQKSARMQKSKLRGFIHSRKWYQLLKKKRK